MSKQCKIIEDLLPLYHDGVCSEESRELVDTHLAQCEDCRKALAQIDIELLSPAEADSDIDILKGITKKIILSKRKALVKGIIIAFALILAIFLYNAFLWYAQEYTFYAPFTEDLAKITAEHDSGTVLFYYKRDDTYTYSVYMPEFLSRGGDVRIVRNDNGGGQVFEAGIAKQDKDTYYFLVRIIREDPEDNHSFYVDADLNLYQWKYRYETDSKMAQIQAELDDHIEEIRDMIGAAKAMWPFIQ